MRRQVIAEAGGAYERLGELFRLCSPDLHRYIQRRLRRSMDAADLTQEIFERFIRGDSLARSRDPRAYLFGIASHVVADAKMAERRDIVTYDSELSEQAGAEPPGGESGGVEDIALQDELSHALEQISEVHRAALLLTKRDGLSCKEAALRMGTTEGSIRVYVCEARAQLKMLLKRS